MRLDNMTKMYFNGKECGAAYFNGQKVWGTSIPQPEQPIRPEDFKSLLLYVGTNYTEDGNYPGNWSGDTGIPYTDAQIRRIATELGDTRIIINTNPNVSRWLFNGQTPFTLQDIEGTSWRPYVGKQGFYDNELCPLGQQYYNRTRFNNTAAVWEAYDQYIPFAIQLTRKLLNVNPNLKIWLSFPIGVDYFTSMAHYSKNLFSQTYTYFKTNLSDVWNNIEGFYYPCEAGLGSWENTYPKNSSMELLQYLKDRVLEGQKLMWIPYMGDDDQNNYILQATATGLVDYMCIPSGYVFDGNSNKLNRCDWIKNHINDYDNFGYEVEWDYVHPNNYEPTLTYFNQCKGKGPMCFYIGARNPCGNNLNNYDFDRDFNVAKDFINSI